MEWLSILLIFVLVGVVVFFKLKEKNGYTAKEESEQIDYTVTYQKKYLLTKNEWYEYKKTETIR